MNAFRENVKSSIFWDFWPKRPNFGHFLLKRWKLSKSTWKIFLTCWFLTTCKVTQKSNEQVMNIFSEIIGITLISTIWKEFNHIQSLVVLYLLCCTFLHSAQTSVYITPIPKTPVSDEWEIPPSNIELKDRIGSGAFGSVYIGHLLDEDTNQDPSIMTSTGHNTERTGFARSATQRKVAVKVLKG